MFYCTHCGQKLNKEDIYCPNCGTKVLTSEEIKDVEITQTDDANESKPPTEVNNTEPLLSTMLSSAKQQVEIQAEGTGKSGILQRKKHLIVAGMLTLVVVGLSFAYWNNKGALTPITQKTESNKQTQNSAKSSNDDGPLIPVHAKITGTDVRMRRGYGTDYEIVGYFDLNEVVEVLDYYIGWKKVKRSNGQIGWVSSDFCKQISYQYWLGKNSQKANEMIISRGRIKIKQEPNNNSKDMDLCETLWCGHPCAKSCGR